MILSTDNFNQQRTFAAPSILLGSPPILRYRQSQADCAQEFGGPDGSVIQASPQRPPSKQRQKGRYTPSSLTDPVPAASLLTTPLQNFFVRQPICLQLHAQHQDNLSGHQHNYWLASDRPKNMGRTPCARKSYLAHVIGHVLL